MKDNSIFEKDFDLKNRKAMRGVSESEDEFAKRNKKAWKNLEKELSNELIILLMVLMVFLILFGILTATFIILVQVIL